SASPSAYGGIPGWGEHIKLGKYTTGSFSDELVTALAAAIHNWQPHPSPTWITCVPSRNRPDLVPNFTDRLAQALNLPYIPCVSKIKQNQEQKFMQNSSQQASNLDGCFEITSPVPQGSVLLVDDMVDSRWTMTVIAALLRQAVPAPSFRLRLLLIPPIVEFNQNQFTIVAVPCLFSPKPTPINKLCCCCALTLDNSVLGTHSHSRSVTTTVSLTT
ncbi:MAG: hypothetical protein HC924_19560, partial [Synechococcaceae cyanobacterium SM2_3_2]|nr:hypothetical protein [Synechococcaceae cyanobacterium SM2_3_2]